MATLKYIQSRLDRIEIQDRRILGMAKNEAKSDSREMTIEALLRRLREEVNELTNAVETGKLDQALLECSDVRNFAMFLHDRIILQEYQELLEFAVIKKYMPSGCMLVVGHDGKMYITYESYSDMVKEVVNVYEFSDSELLPVYNDFFEYQRFFSPVEFRTVIGYLRQLRNESRME
jgi:NTP pyrophosphatase (non-canonical NTP hydrolase)